MSLKIPNVSIPEQGISTMIDASKTQINNFINDLSTITSEEIQIAVDTANEMGTPFFTMESLNETVHPLAQLLRYLFIVNNITIEKFTSLHEQLALQTCMSSNHKNSERNNTKRALMLPEITWNTFEKVMSICGFELTDVCMMLKNRATDVVSELSRNRVADTINEYNNTKTKTEFDRVTM